MKNIEVVEEEVSSLDFEDNTVIASGPLTSDALSAKITEFFGAEQLHFFDAAAPIVTADSIDMVESVFCFPLRKGNARNDRNCPMTKEEYDAFYNELINAKQAVLHGFVGQRSVRGLYARRSYGARGRDTLLFGPLKPVGLIDPSNRKTFGSGRPTPKGQCRKFALQYRRLSDALAFRRTAARLCP